MRPKKERIVKHPPVYTKFKPIGIPLNDLKKISLTIDEFEAIRLADLEAKDHLTASIEMGISRSTFTRLIESARKKSAEMLVEGALLTIEGGEITFSNKFFRCSMCRKNKGPEGNNYQCKHCDKK